MAMLLNEFFSSVFTTEDQTNVPRLDCQVEWMADITIQIPDVQNKLQDLIIDTWSRWDIAQTTERIGGTDGVSP